MNNTDLHIIQQIIEGDKAAFKLLYEKYSKLYFLICCRYFQSKEDAKDMLQESFIKIFRDLKQFDSERGQFKYWSKKVVINTCLQKLRKKTVLDDFDCIENQEQNIGISPEVLSSLSLQELTGLIHKLPAGRRIVFNLYVIDGFTHKQISEQLGISVSTSKTQLMKAKRVLQSNIENLNNADIRNYARG